MALAPSPVGPAALAAGLRVHERGLSRPHVQSRPRYPPRIRLPYAAPLALAVFLRRRLDRHRLLRSHRRCRAEPSAGQSPTVTIERPEITKDVQLPVFEDLGAQALDTNFRTALSSYLQGLGSVTERLRVSELSKLLDFKLDWQLPLTFAQEFTVAKAKKLLMTPWKDSKHSAPSAPPTSRYWHQRGVQVPVRMAPRGYTLGVEDLTALAQMVELSRLSYYAPGEESLTFDVDFVEYVDESTTDELSTLAWFAADMELQGQACRVFSIRGSWRVTDWSINLDFEPIPFEPELQASRHPVLAHRGFYRAAQALARDPKLLAALADALRSGRTVAFAGHSLGGSAAELLALILVLHGQLPPERLQGVVTVGAAEALCARGRRLARRAGLDRKRFLNLVNLHDGVPRLTSCAYPEFVGRMVVHHEVNELGFNPYVKLCEAMGLPKPNKQSWYRHAAFLNYSRLCEPIGVVAHLVPDGRRGIGLRAEVLEHLGDIHAAFDTPGLAVLTNSTTQLMEFHSTDSYLEALANARRWVQHGGRELSARYLLRGGL